MTEQQTAAMRKALEALLSMKEALAEHDEPTTFNEDEAITALRQALEQQPDDEPDELTIAFLTGLERGKDLARPQPAAREPLTDEQMKKVHLDAGITYLVPGDYDRHLFTHITDIQLMKVSRAVEAAHGITAPQQKDTP